jgi:hypothetical protein
MGIWERFGEQKSQTAEDCCLHFPDASVTMTTLGSAPMMFGQRGQSPQLQRHTDPSRETQFFLLQQRPDPITALQQ